jgi:transcriptional regulator with XRE-family HTH domain
MTQLSNFEGKALKSLRSPPHIELLRRLVAARQKAGLTQEQLAAKLQRNQSFVAKYETGERRLEVIEFVQICRVIGAAPERLIGKLP